MPFLDMLEEILFFQLLINRFENELTIDNANQFF